MLHPPTVEQQDHSLWIAMRNGSVGAFEQLYDRYFPQLFSYAMRFCADRDLVKDCLQDFFVEIYQRRDSLSEVQRVKQYLFVSFRHRIMKHLSGRRLMSEPLRDDYHFEVCFSHEDQLIEDQFDAYRKQQLLKAFSNLSSRQKEAIFLRFYENMRYDEIADIMKMKEVKYARTLVYRSLVSLRASVKGKSLTLYSFLPFFFNPFLQRH
jgi:RNA polymerase sigma factor (sigma-70 family)